MYARPATVFAKPSTRSFLDKSFLGTVERAIAQSQVVSFDVFDTLLRRPFLSPKHVFSAIELNARRHEFAARRIAAEQAARVRHADRDEISLDDIYDLLGGDPAEELEFERAVIYPRDDILAWLHLARESGKKIVAVSDMYLPKSFVSELLQRLHVPYDDLIVSATDQVTKHSGSAFKQLITRHAVAPNCILHFGDDAFSDHYVPSKLRIRSVLLRNDVSSDMDNTPVASLIADLKEDGSPHASMLGSVIRDLTFSKEPAEFWTTIGRYYAAPLSLAYAQWVHRQVTERGLDRVAFIARDGFLPMQAFTRLAPDFPTRYLHLSRAVALRTCLTSSSDIVLKNLCGGSKTRVSNYISRLGDSTADLLSAARRHFHGDPIVGTDISPSDLDEFFSTQRDLLHAIAAAARPLLIRYLAENDMLDRPEKIAVVDVGWNGTAAALLAESVPESRHWNWLYVGSTPHHHPESPPHRAMYFQYGHPRQHYELVYDCVEIFEFLFTAPEATTLALEEKAGRIAPVSADSQTNWPGWEARINAMHAGALDCMPTYLDAVRRHGLVIDTSAFTRVLTSIMRTDDPTFIKEFSAIQHQAGLGGSTFFPLLPPTDPRHYWSNVLRLAKGKKLKGDGGLVYWNSQYERHFLAQLKGIKSHIAQLAMQIRRRRKHKVL